MIKSIELCNWKTHLNSRFEFAKGTNVLVGQMGSGKTSVMDAICFALFGTFPALQQRKVLLQEIITARPNPTEKASVVLCFDYDGKEFKVERTIKAKGSSEAMLFIDGKFYAGPKPSDVNCAIEQSIDMSYNLFSRAVYSEQNQIDFFLRLSPGQRKEKFDELLELDKYERVRSNAVSALNRLRAIASDKRKWLRELSKENPEVELSKLEKMLGEKERRLAELKVMGEKKKSELARLREEAKRFEEAEKLFNEFKEQASKSSFLRERLERELSDLKKRLKGMHSKEIEKRIEEKKRMEKHLEDEIASLEQRERELIEKEGFKQQEIRGNKEKITEIESQTKQIMSASSSCPMCKGPLDEKKRGAIAKENHELVEALNSKNAALSKEIAAIEGLRKKTEEKILSKKREKEGVATELVELKQALELAEEIKGKELQAKRAKEGEEKALERIVELGFDEEKAKRLRETLARAESELNANEREQLSVKEVLNGIQRETRQARKALEQIRQLKASVKTIEGNCEKLLLFINALRETQRKLRESLIETINEAMDSIWQKIYPYSDYSGAKMAVDQGNYELVVKDSLGKWVRVEGILSGGERSAAAICIRIAFSLVLARNLSWIILDEPTHNLDSTAVRRLSEMMRESLPDLIEQVFVITHDKEMEKAASGKLYMLKRDKDSDAHTEVEEMPLES